MDRALTSIISLKWVGIGSLYFLALFCVVLAGIPVFVVTVRRLGILLDAPRDRSSHKYETVSGAGVFIVWAALLTWILINIVAPIYYLTALTVSALLIAAVSFWDDVKGASISLRLSVQFIAATLFLFHVPVPDFLIRYASGLELFWYPAAALFIVGITNLYNFMDGIDGITAAHTIALLLCWGTLNSVSGSSGFEWVLCLSLIVPLSAFLLYNWHPARIFMGDTGSTFLGFSLACFAIVQVPGVERSNNFFAIVMLMMPFLFDAVFTLATRFLKGEQWYRPHRRHLFQRLVDCGVNQRIVSSVYCMITFYIGGVLICIDCQLVSRYVSAVTLIMIPYALLYLWVLRAQIQEDGGAPLSVVSEGAG